MTKVQVAASVESAGIVNSADIYFVLKHIMEIYIRIYISEWLHSLKYPKITQYKECPAFYCFKWKIASEWTLSSYLTAGNAFYSLWRKNTESTTGSSKNGTFFLIYIIFLIDFREKGRERVGERESERERHWCGRETSIHCYQGLNSQLLVHEMTLQPTEPPQLGQNVTIHGWKNFLWIKYLTSLDTLNSSFCKEKQQEQKHLVSIANSFPTYSFPFSCRAISFTNWRNKKCCIFFESLKGNCVLCLLYLITLMACF